MNPSPDTSPNTAPGATSAPADDHLTTFYREIGISAVAAALNAMVDSLRRADSNTEPTKTAATKTAA
jgi:hypothetical protein